MSKASRLWKEWHKEENIKYPQFTEPRKNLTLKGYRKIKRFLNMKNCETKKRNEDFESWCKGR